MVKEVTDNSFKDEVEGSHKLVLVDFWAEWCGPCKILSPIIDELATEFEGQVKVLKINIDHHPQTPSTIGIKSIPTLILYKNGKPIDSKLGVRPKDHLNEWIKKNI